MASTGAQHRMSPPRSLFRRTFLPILLVLVGLLVMLYPVYATQWNNPQQQRIAEKYEQDLKAQDPATLNRAVEEARRYNETHKSGPILDPWLARVSENNPGYKEYLAQLSGQGPMSQVVIPAIKSRLPVYHGSTEEVLQKGLGHLYGTSLPVGGKGTHAVITGHTGMANATLWDNLVHVKKGDSIYVSTFGVKLKYQVHATEVVLPDKIDSLTTKPGQDLLTLVTCTPYGVNTYRLLVHAHRGPMDPDEAGVFDEHSKLMQWWMWLLLAAAVLIIVLTTWWFLRERKKHKAREQSCPCGPSTNIGKRTAISPSV